MIESVTVFPNKEPEEDKKNEKNEKNEKNGNITDTTGVTFKSLVSLLFFVFLCVILAATLSDKVTNVIVKDGVVAAHYLGTHSDKFPMMFR